jgi:hypothetical protein
MNLTTRALRLRPRDKRAKPLRERAHEVTSCGTTATVRAQGRHLDGVGYVGEDRVHLNSTAGAFAAFAGDVSFLPSHDED